MAASFKNNDGATGSADERSPLLDEDTRSKGILPDYGTGVEVQEYNSSRGLLLSSKLDKEEPPRRPWGPCIILLAISAVQPLCFELIFPFINQMVLENGITDDPEKVGFYTGFIESIFQITGFFAVLPCSWVSDRIGRKPVILVGTVGMAASIALFGMSKTYGTMIAMRCIGGLSGGVMSAIKTTAGEMFTNKAQLTQVLAMWQISYKIGQVIGQPLGGLLSHPARTMPIFDTPFWREYPYALPCFVSAFWALFFDVWAFFTLPETLSKKKGDDIVDSNNKKKPNIFALPPNVVSLLISLFPMVLATEMVFVVYPLFGFTPLQSGGLSLTEPQIGVHMGLRCTLNIIVLFTYTPLSAHINSMKLYRVAMWVWPVIVGFFPVLHAIGRYGSGVNSPTFFATLVPFFILWSIGNLVWPSHQIVLQHMCPSPDMLATINSLAQMIYIAMFAVTPAMMTTIYAYSIKHQIWRGNMVYVIMVGIGIFGGCFVLALKDPDAQGEKQADDEEP